jgi:hypothetical protein
LGGAYVSHVFIPKGVVVKVTVFLVSYLVATAVASASEPIVPPDFVGMWAISPSTCSLQHDSTLRILDSGDVEYKSVRGRIHAGSSLHNKSIEVAFLTAASRAKSQNMRVYRLTTDGSKLLEIRDEQVVATRIKCEPKSA